MNETYHAVVTGVYAEDLGDQLVADAPIGDGILSVRDVADFDEDGGWLLLNGAVLEYETVDDDDSSITLTLPLVAAALTDDVVAVWDEPNASKATVYKAVVDQIDGFDGVANAVVQQSVAHALSQSMRDGTGESVTLTRDDDNELQLVAVHGRAFSLAALQYLQGGLTTRTAEDQAGIDVVGAGTDDPRAPGVYLYDTGGKLAMFMSDDVAGGVIKFWTNDPTETGPGWINPFVVVDGAGTTLMLEVAGPHGGGHRSRIQLSDDLVYLDPGSGSGQVLIASGDLVTFNGNVSVNGINVTCKIPNAPTTASAANVHVAGDGSLQQVTSLRAHKADIREIGLDDAVRLLEVAGVTFYDRREVDENDGTGGLRRGAGFLADDVADRIPELALYDDDGELRGVAYDRVPAYLIPIVRDQQEQIDALAARLADLEARQE